MSLSNRLIRFNTSSVISVLKRLYGSCTANRPSSVLVHGERHALRGMICPMKSARQLSPLIQLMKSAYVPPV